MSDQQGSSLSAGGNRTIEIRYKRSNFFGGIAICVMLVAGGIAWAILAPSQVSMFVLLFAFLAPIILFERARTFLDPRPVVVMDASGIRDRRLGFLLIPWSRISSADVENRVTGIFIGKTADLHVGVRLHLKERLLTSNPALPEQVYVDLAPFDTDVNEFVKQMRHFAPHLRIDQSHNNAAP
jgi:hypothetical protein